MNEEQPHSEVPATYVADAAVAETMAHAVDVDANSIQEANNSSLDADPYPDVTEANVSAFKNNMQKTLNFIEQNPEEAEKLYLKAKASLYDKIVGEVSRMCASEPTVLEEGVAEAIGETLYYNYVLSAQQNVDGAFSTEIYNAIHPIIDTKHS